MTTLVLGLYVEGNTDKLVLPILVQRTAQQIIDRHRKYEIDVLPPVVLNDYVVAKSTYVQRVVEAARYAAGYHILILHRDADHSSPRRALTRYIDPACQRVLQERGKGTRLCAEVVPIIPVREMEAWLLADPEALRDVLQVTAKVESLGLPAHPHEVETMNAKQALNQIVKSIRPKADLNELYEPLASIISLQRLEQLGAYRHFVEALTKKLIALGMVQKRRSELL